MKSVILILASVIVLTKPLWPVVEFAVNYEYIVNTLCENRDKPEMECNGKCYLTKALAEEANASDKNPLGQKSSKTEIPQIIISEAITEFLFSAEVLFFSKDNITYIPNLKTSLFIPKILHPPQLG